MREGDIMANLFIARLPTLSNVEAFEAELVAQDIRQGFLQVLKSKCRELARSESSLLVSPTTSSLHTSFRAHPPMTLWIMAKSGFIGNSNLQEKLKHLGIKVLGRVNVSESILQSCYQFSLTARLAPKWNRLTSWLVQGLEFLSTGRAHAVVLQVGVTKTEMTLSVNVSKLTFNFLQPSDLEVSATTLNAFTSDPRGVIRESSIYHNRCVLIPNLTVGYIFSASHQLPSSPEFPTYDTIRVHWKKQHGMILPEKQSLFFQVFFKFNSRTFFSYPGCCVLKSPPTVSTTRDSRAVASSFIADVHARMPTLCGEPIRYSNKALTPFTHLQAASLPSAYPNVRPATAPRPASMSRPGPPSSVRNTTQSTTRGNGTGLKLIQRVSAAVAPTGLPPETTHHHRMQTVPDNDRGLTNFSASSSLSTTLSQKYSNRVRNGSVCQPSIHMYDQPSSQLMPRRDTAEGSGALNGDRVNTRIVPVFKPSHSATRLSGAQLQGPKKSAPIKPSFKPTTVSTAHHTAQTVPTLAMKQRRSVGAQQTHQKQLGQKRTLSEHSLLPAKQPRASTLVASGTTHTAGSGTKNVMTGSNGCSHSQNLKQPVSNSSSEQTVPDLSWLNVPGADSVDLNSSGLSLHPTVASSTGRPTHHSSSTGSRGGGSGQTAQKKGRGAKKAAIQVEGVSGETMNKISKVKAPLLRRWLQENGVKCTSKKTKEDMVRMAAEHVRDTGITFTVPS